MFPGRDQAEFGVFALIGAVVLQAGCATVHAESPQGSVTVESQPLNLDTRPCIDAFESHRLPHVTQGTAALALILTDVDADGRRDILVGNDFHPPDAVFLNKPEGWIDAAPFTSTTTNTMSFAEGDVDNDGIPELLATDMKPYPQDESVDNAWGPLLDKVGDLDPNDGVQIAANVLQTRTAAGAGFVERAEAAGVDATGWSWSAQFGDLDNDGFLDLYVVNGSVLHHRCAARDRPELALRRLR